MSWLHLIPGYRALRIKLTLAEAERDEMAAEVQRLTAQNAILESRVDAAENERARVWALAEQAIAGERTALHMAVNEYWQKTYGVTPHPDAPCIPINATHTPDAGGPVRAAHNFGGAAVANAQDRFKRQYLERLEAANKTPAA